MEQKTWHRDDPTGQYVHEASISVNAPADTCYQIWAQLENLPQIMRYVTNVVKTGPNTSHWEAKLIGQHLEWDAVTTVNVNDTLAWESTSGLKNSGSVRFVPMAEGCRIVVHIMYDPPYGVLGDLVAAARVNDEFHRDLMEDLQHYKTAVESGEMDRYRRAA
jgi:uncharacterized membrane protein